MSFKNRNDSISLIFYVRKQASIFTSFVPRPPFFLSFATCASALGDNERNHIWVEGNEPTRGRRSFASVLQQLPADHMKWTLPSSGKGHTDTTRENGERPRQHTFSQTGSFDVVRVGVWVLTQTDDMKNAHTQWLPLNGSHNWGNKKGLKS